ncbi:hypothetical protein BAG01nite_23620 [Brevibacillus agri]|uniref:Uncharacterized protein n=1 Tax=Brevibacillus agri TaxID=51101 RepID=A0ABQ0SSC0_9BACL|nr:hypothetical protein BAG01nite_23620 [Brevibacillus agri]
MNDERKLYIDVEKSWERCYVILLEEFNGEDTYHQRGARAGSGGIHFVRF